MYRLIILNIYEIPNLDQNMVRLFNAILLAIVLFASEAQKRLRVRGLKLEISREKSMATLLSVRYSEDI